MTTQHIVCPSCNAVNRVAQGREPEATCGKCGSLLFQPSPLSLTRDSLDRQVGRSDVPVLVDFFSPTCGPCQMMAPQFGEAAAYLYPRMRLAKVDTSQEQALAARFSIRSVPTLILFRGGREVVRQSGAMSAGDIAAWAGQHA